MASELPIVTALRDDNSDTVYIERHQAADIITELTEALRSVQIEAEREQGSWVHLKRVIALNCKQVLAKAGGTINE
jgi:hypothetical protein